jgi:oligosaccharide repeat unit polymerase
LSINAGLLLLPLIALGMVIAPVPDVWAHTFFACMVYPVLVWGVLLHATRWADPLNPLTLLVGIGFLKFTLPLLVLIAVGSRHSSFDFYRKLGVMDEELIYRAHTLVMVGMCALLLGWSVASIRALKNRVEFPVMDLSVVVRAAGLFVIGAAALFLFIGSNASSDVLASGDFRSTQITAGTGKYFFLSFVLISGSVVLTSLLLERRRLPVVFAFLPVVIALAFFFVTGGRTRSLTPVMAGVIAFFYVRLDRKLNLKTIVGAALLFTCILAFYYLGYVFRGGAGVSILTSGTAGSDRSFGDYVVGFFAAELGQLSSIAGAIHVGGGVIGGKSFTSLLFPLDKLLDLPGRSCGVFLVQKLQDLPPGSGAVHSTLIGDGYLNFGFTGMIVVMFIAGLAMQLFYRLFRLGGIHVSVLAVATVYAVRVFGEEINKWPELIIAVSGCWMATVPVRFREMRAGV